jgi:hypothetical protein
MSNDRNESAPESGGADDEQTAEGSEAAHPAESISDKVKSLLPDGWLDR